MSNPHTTDYDKPVPLGPPIQKETKPTVESVWKDMQIDPRHQYRILPNGTMEVRRRDAPLLR